MCIRDRYNASLTIDNYYSALVNHDFYGQDRSAGSKKPKTYDYSLCEDVYKRQGIYVGICGRMDRGAQTEIGLADDALRFQPPFKVFSIMGFQ